MGGYHPCRSHPDANAFAIAVSIAGAIRGSTQRIPRFAFPERERRIACDKCSSIAPAECYAWK